MGPKLFLTLNGTLGYRHLRYRKLAVSRLLQTADRAKTKIRVRLFNTNDVVS